MAPRMRPTAFAAPAGLTVGLRSAAVAGAPLPAAFPACFVFAAPRRREGVAVAVPPAARPRRPAAGLVMISLFPWAPRKERDPKVAYGFEAGYAYLAHPEKGSGEDAFFVEGNCAGVFDGVSGAAETQGVDPRLFSQTLAALTAEKARKYGPKGVVKAAIEASRENTQIGASTACVLGLDEYGRLFGVNLGDSGVCIIRDRKILFRTKEQQHFFNCPYQLSSVTSAGVNDGDSITMGQNIQQNLKVGDWIVLATDGLFDNVFPKDIVATVNKAESPQELADQLGDMAAENSVDKERASPFEGAARMAKVEWKGGKVDDVTVVVLRVTDDPNLVPQTVLSSV